MRPIIFILSALSLIGLAFWAYRENYATQLAMRNVGHLQNEIAGLRETLQLQRAEWAYLNRPSRLRDLASLNFDRLGLLPMEPEQFGEVGQIANPPPPPIPFDPDNAVIANPTDVSGTLSEDPL